MPILPRPIVPWKDEYEVGVEAIDAEHQTLVEMINTAHESVDRGTTPEDARTLVAAMQEYAETHFATEERLMMAHAYPGAADHIAEHVDFLSRVKADTDSFADDDVIPGTVKVLSFLADWLVAHILRTDRELGRFLADKGIR